MTNLLMAIVLIVSGLLIAGGTIQMIRTNRKTVEIAQKMEDEIILFKAETKAEIEAMQKDLGMIDDKRKPHIIT